MTDHLETPDWKLAADAEVAAQLGRLTIDNAMLRAQGRAQIGALQREAEAHAQTQRDLAQAKEDLAAANAQIALLKDVKPAPLAAHEAAG